MLKAWATGIGIIVLATAAGSAQTQRPTEEDQVRARQKISMMEGVFERAVGNGVENVVRRFKAITPLADGFMLTGTPVVRGFRLDDYGVFFDVEVPALRPPLAYTLGLAAMRDAASVAMLRPQLAELKSLMQRLPESGERQQLAQVVSRLERIAPSQPSGPARATGAGGSGFVSAQSLDQRPATVSAAAVEPQSLEDPNEAFTREVKSALIDAMLENTGSLAIAPNEWLQVAARDNLRTDQLLPSDASDLHTIMFRVKGSDLAAFRSGTITIEEARRRVVVRED